MYMYSILAQHWQIFYECQSKLLASLLGFQRQEGNNSPSYYSSKILHFLQILPSSKCFLSLSLSHSCFNFWMFSWNSCFINSISSWTSFISSCCCLLVPCKCLNIFPWSSKDSSALDPRFLGDGLPWDIIYMYLYTHHELSGKKENMQIIIHVHVNIKSICKFNMYTNDGSARVVARL